MSTQSYPVVTSFDKDRQVLQAKWIINDYKNITSKSICSNLFSHPSAPQKWTLSVYPNGHNEQSMNHLSYFLRAHGDMTFAVNANYSLGYENKNGATSLLEQMKFTFYKDHTSFGFGNLATMEVVNDNFLKADGSLTLLAEIDYATLKWGPSTQFNRYKVGKDLGLALDGEYTNVDFEVGGHIIKAHKVIIAYRSEYFKAMFDADKDSSESQTSKIKITEVKFAIMRGLLEFLYSGAIEFTNVAFASSLRIAADKYLVPELVEVCEDYIVANVDKRTAAKAILETSLLGSDRIRKACLEVFKKRTNFQDIDNFADVLKDATLAEYVVDAMAI